MICKSEKNDRLRKDESNEKKRMERFVLTSFFSSPNLLMHPLPVILTCAFFLRVMNPLFFYLSTHQSVRRQYHFVSAIRSLATKGLHFFFFLVCYCDPFRWDCDQHFFLEPLSSHHPISQRIMIVCTACGRQLHLLLLSLLAFAAFPRLDQRLLINNSVITDY